MLILLAVALLQERLNAGEPQRIEKAWVREVMLSDPQVRRDEWAYATLFFLSGGTSALICEPRGVVRQVSLPDLGVEAAGRLPGAVTVYTLSAKGLLALTKKEEILLIDVPSLEVKNTFKAPRVRFLASSPGLDVAYVNGERFSLDTIDLGRGNPIQRHDPERVFEDFDHRVKKPEGENIRFSGFAGPILCSPDGNYVISGSNYASRFAVSGYNLRHEEIGRSLSSGHPEPRISADSKYFCVPGTASGPSLVVSLTDFRSFPAAVPREYPLTDMDVAGNRVYGLYKDKNEYVVGQFDFRGERLSAVPIRPRLLPISDRLFVSPDGRYAAMPFNHGLYWLEWK